MEEQKIFVAELGFVAGSRRKGRTVKCRSDTYWPTMRGACIGVAKLAIKNAAEWFLTMPRTIAFITGLGIGR